MDTKTFFVEGYGTVTIDNAVFVQHCCNLDKIQAMEVGDTFRCKFRGCGTTSYSVVIRES